MIRHVKKRNRSPAFYINYSRMYNDYDIGIYDYHRDVYVKMSGFK